MMQINYGTVKYLVEFSALRSASMSDVTAPIAAPVAPAAGTEHRARLLEGMARAVAAKGYADTTIADIVREASVSRRTFYENFADKAECLTALYEACLLYTSPNPRDRG